MPVDTAEERLMRTRRGQALMELAVGLFSLALVVSFLCGFAVYIASSLEAQNNLRVGLGTGGGQNTKSGSVEVGQFAAERLFGSETLEYKERVELPSTVIVR